jgi:hypothetical protein
MLMGLFALVCFALEAAIQFTPALNTFLHKPKYLTANSVFSKPLNVINLGQTNN